MAKLVNSLISNGIRKRKGFEDDHLEEKNLLAQEQDDYYKSEDACDIPSVPEEDNLQKKNLELHKKWSLCNYEHLPEWLQDNEYITCGHRPPIPCIKTCFKSIFWIHAETGNIWTHLIGFLIFIGIMVYFIAKHVIHIGKEETWVFLAFFLGAILCLGFSWTFHTFYCHSENMGRLFSKLDYCGISLLIVGSFVPWVYFGFYCHFTPKVIHLTIVSTLGIGAMCVSLIDKFALPSWRPFRTAVFIIFGMSALGPAVHYALLEGWLNHISQKALGWLVLMGVLYISGAMLYVLRVPERWYPGKFDFWFHSHQIFHVFVVAAALVHFHGVSELAMHRLSIGGCDLQSPIAVY